MGRLARLYHSTLGKKAIVAVTGILLFGFVAGHMLGNLKAFTGTGADGVPHIDEYAHFLRVAGAPLLPHGAVLWSVRIVLLAALVLHVALAIQLALGNRAARPIRYQQHVFVASTRAARSMMVTGIALLVFIVLHILHFTTGTIDITPVVPETVYANIYYAFGVWFIALFYVLAMAVLALHLYHGVWSLFQTLGLDNPDRNRGLRMFAIAAAVVLFLGFCAVPVLFFAGVMPDPPAGGP